MVEPRPPRSPSTARPTAWRCSPARTPPWSTKRWQGSAASLPPGTTNPTPIAARSSSKPATTCSPRPQTGRGSGFAHLSPLKSPCSTIGCCRVTSITGIATTFFPCSAGSIGFRPASRSRRLRSVITVASSVTRRTGIQAEAERFYRLYAARGVQGDRRSAGGRSRSRDLGVARRASFFSRDLRHARLLAGKIPGGEDEHQRLVSRRAARARHPAVGESARWSFPSTPPTRRFTAR